MSFVAKSNSRLYLAFKAIREDNFRNILDFYTINSKKIDRLPFEESFEMHVLFLSSLFEIGYYEKFLTHVDAFIESLVYNNITIHRGEFIYQKILFQKATSLYNLLEIEQSKYIIKELIKINPNNILYFKLLKKCIRKEHSKYFHQISKFALLFLFSAGIMTFISLMLNWIYPEVSTLKILKIRNLSFLCFGINITFAFTFHWWKSEKAIKSIITK